ncbi:MAG: hypothetical protein JNM17_03780, partial [Archangium sp.]|nr:hypothetical protein [Archangium sp.]
KVNGRTPQIEAALATTLTMQRMPILERRMMLATLGIPKEVIQGQTPAESADLLARIALRSNSPGSYQFEFRVSGARWLLGLKVGANGIEGAGAMPKPPSPPFWKEALGPLLSFVSIAFPPAAPFLQTANALYAIDQGAKGLGLVSAIAGAAAGVANITNAASAATLASVANTLSSANGVLSAVKNRDVLSAFSSVATLAGGIGSLAKVELGAGFSLLQRAGTIAGVAAKVRNDDWVGLLSDGMHTLNEMAQQAIREAETKPTPPPAPEETEATSGPAETEAPNGIPSELETIPIEVETDNAPVARTVKVVAGDNLTKLATRLLGNAALAPELYAWNAARIGNDPNLLRTGVVLELPPPGFRLSTSARNEFFTSTHLIPVTAPAVPTNARPNEETKAVLTELSRATTELAQTPSTDTDQLERLKEYINGLKLKAELGLGLKKLELSWDADGLHLEFKPASAEFSTNGTLVKLAAEPSLVVNENGLELQLKLVGAAGPVEAGVKGVIGTDGKLDFEHVLGVQGDLFAIGGKILGVGAKVGVEIGAPRRPSPPPASPWFGDRGAIAP